MYRLGVEPQPKLSRFLISVYKLDRGRRDEFVRSIPVYLNNRLQVVPIIVDSKGRVKVFVLALSKPIPHLQVYYCERGWNLSQVRKLVVDNEDRDVFSILMILAKDSTIISLKHLKAIITMSTPSRIKFSDVISEKDFIDAYLELL